MRHRALLAAGAAAWTPASLSPAMWLDASDATTVTLDGSSKVSAWADKSGNGRGMSQGTAANRPTYADTRNGLSVVTCAASVAQWMTGTTWGPSTSAITIAAVIQNYNSANARVAFSLGSNNHIGVTVRGDSTGSVGALLGGVAWLTTSTASTTNWSQLIVRRTGGTNTVRLNAADLTVTGGGSSTPGAASGSMWIGGDSTAKGYWRIAEIVVVNGSALTGGDLTSLESYLNQKWAVY